MIFKKNEVEEPYPHPEHEGVYFEVGDSPLLETVLVTYKCYVQDEYYGHDDPYKYRRACYIYNDNNDFKNYTLSEGDYINIRSDTTLEEKHLLTKFSYLVTFLIELDPL